MRGRKTSVKYSDKDTNDGINQIPNWDSIDLVTQISDKN